MAAHGFSLVAAAVVVAVAGLVLVWASEARRRRAIARRGRSHWDVHDGDDYGHMELDIDVVKSSEDS